MGDVSPCVLNMHDSHDADEGVDILSKPPQGLK